MHYEMYDYSSTVEDTMKSLFNLMLCYHSSTGDSGTLPQPVGDEESVKVEKYILPFER